MRRLIVSILPGLVAAGLLASSPADSQVRLAQEPSQGRPTPQPASAAKIQWRTALYGAFEEALQVKKPLVVYFYQRACQWCDRIEAGPFASPEVNALGDKAVFARIDYEQDDQHKNVSKMVQSLRIDRFPTVVLLDVWPDAIMERGRVVGYFDILTYYFRLSQLFLEPPATKPTPKP